VGEKSQEDKTAELTNERPLAQVLGFVVVMLPLEQSKRLVDQWQDIDAPRLVALLQLHSPVELLDGLLVFLLVQEELAIVVVDIGHIFKVFQRSPEGRHGGGNRSHLILSHTELNIRIDEVAIHVNGFLIIFRCFRELAQNEMKLRTVIIDIWIVFVLC
jgi:hypothetical protein